MNILEKIISHKREDVERRRNLYPLALLEKSHFFNSQPISMRKYLLREDLLGIIAEFKRKSPSKGDINRYASVERTTIGYMQAGASALSVLTDETFFGGKSEDLITARKFNFCPILRKDFVVDEYQVVEAKSIGADAILLIAAVLHPAEIEGLAKLAHSFGMEVLLEVHDREELAQSFNEHIDMVGVNNRNLKTFEVDIQTSLDLLPFMPQGVVKISESGISSAAAIHKLKAAGYEGFLIGETFMKHSRPEKACAELIKSMRE
jgi:indole-3-glycerol phosphate synthase